MANAFLETFAFVNYASVGVWDSAVTKGLSLQYFGVTTLTDWGHVTLFLTWP